MKYSSVPKKYDFFSLINMHQSVLNAGKLWGLNGVRTDVNNEKTDWTRREEKAKTDPRDHKQYDRIE